MFVALELLRVTLYPPAKLISPEKVNVFDPLSMPVPPADAERINPVLELRNNSTAS